MDPLKRKTDQPVSAATVILARQYRRELQIYLLQRHPRSAFMAGKFVFPGGTIDASDIRAAAWQKRVDLNREEIKWRLGGDLNGREALCHAVAAIRETYEEAGVLLAQMTGGSCHAIEMADQLRPRQIMPKGWFLKQANAAGWVLTLSALSRWSRWITPRRMHRRYDTRFFLAVMPLGQTCRPDNREATRGVWISPAEGLAANLAGEVPMSPPTLVVMNELLPFTSLEDLLVFSQDRLWGAAMLPRLIPFNNGALIIEPWDEQYDNEDIPINPRGWENQVLPVGAPFSRLWYSGGVWRPVRTGR